MMYDCITRPGKPTAKLIGVDGEHQPRFMVSVPCFVTEPINQAEIILEAPARKRRWGFVILSPSPVLVASAMSLYGLLPRNHKEHNCRSDPLPRKGYTELALTGLSTQRDDGIQNNGYSGIGGNLPADTEERSVAGMPCRQALLRARGSDKGVHLIVCGKGCVCRTGSDSYVYGE